VRILCLTSRLPYPPDRGDRLRAFHILKTLASEHELTLLSFVESPEQLDLVKVLEGFCSEVRVVAKSRPESILTVLANGWRRLPLQVLYYHSRAMCDLVARTLRERSFDAAYVHLFRMAPYLDRVDAPYRIVDLTDMISDEIATSLRFRSVPSRVVYAIEKGRIERFEKMVAADSDEIWLISARERQTLLDRCPSANARVVANGVDLNRFCPLDVEEDPLRILLTGHMSVPHNVDAAVHLAKRVLPVVRQRVEGCQLRIVGANPCPRVRRLDQLPGVEVTGFVPDLNLELNRAAAFVAPLRFAAGIQNKVLEAMAAGRPVVTSPGVADGLGAVADRELLIGHSPDEFAALTIALLSDSALGRRLGAKARDFVSKRFTWTGVAERARAIADNL